MTQLSHDFERAVEAFDTANAEDPRSMTFAGTNGPRELLFSRRVYEWTLKLDPQASEALLLAARGHTLRRWEVPRADYSLDKIGYRRWREACAVHHAQVAENILRSLGYDNSTIGQVSALILKKEWPSNPEARVLEDADCLAFLEMKLEGYLDEWGYEKTVHILRRTLRKMTPQAKNLAASIELSERCKALLQKAGS
jgi:hypothetical protein